MQINSANRRRSGRIPLLAALLVSLLGGSILSSASPAEASPGDEITFMRYFPSGQVIEDIYTTALSGAGATQLTNSPTITDTSPSWSPDGKRIVFTSNGSLAVMNDDGTGFFKLPGTTNGRSPAWSPDGDSIAYVVGLGTNQEIFVYSLAGGGSIQLTNNAKEDDDPSWSPDGSRIVFARTDPSAPGWEVDLWVMRADGSSQVQLTATPGWEARPDWSPDGQTVAYEHGALGVDPQVWAIEVTGSAPQQITHGITSFMPAWSPTGSHIVFARGKDVEGTPVHLWVIDFQRGTERQVTFGDVVDYFPDWR